jgi:hypothetical protein
MQIQKYFVWKIEKQELGSSDCFCLNTIIGYVGRQGMAANI